jgi:hypothetical protein
MKRRIFIRILLHVFFPLLIGLLIYLFYRPNVWIAIQFNSRSVSYSEISNYTLFEKWIIFSGPDLCWAYSFASAIFILNHFYKFSSHAVVFIMVSIFVGASELIQLFLKPNFTFALTDLVSVLIACSLSAYLNKKL